MAQNLLNNGGGNSEDVWDDTELVQHFDKILHKSRKYRDSTILEADTPGPWVEIHEGERELPDFGNTEQPLVLNSENSNKAITFSDSPLWKVGSNCRTVFSEDGIEYEAKVVELLDLSSCIIRFVGYGNEADVGISSLKASHGKKVRDLQRVQALQLQKTEKTSSTEASAEDQSTTSPPITTNVPDPTIDYSELGERVRNIILSRYNACEQPKQELEQTLEPRDRLPLLKARKSILNKNPRSPQASRTQTAMNGSAYVEPNPTPTSFGQGTWTDAFPNLFMPPMPNSIAGQDGRPNYGKGELPSVLMAWYMAGYQAGAFDAKQEIRKKMSKRTGTASARPN